MDALATCHVCAGHLQPDRLTPFDGLAFCPTCEQFRSGTGAEAEQARRAVAAWEKRGTLATIALAREVIA